MASYTYVNNIYVVTTEIHDGYKRFNSRNAQYRHTVDNDFMIEQWDFVSYAYPVMIVDHVLDTDSWEVIVTSDALDCSRTTTRQIGDFLKFIGCPLTIAHIRKTFAMDVAEMYFVNDCSLSVNVRGEVNSRFDIRF